MPKALVIGPRFYNFNSAAGAALQKLGYQVQTESYGVPVDPYGFAARLRYKMEPFKEQYRARNRLFRQEHYRRVFDAACPDVVFILNGEILLADTLDYFRSRAKVALWCFDSVKHIPVITGHISHVDRFYCYDRGDVEFYAGRGEKAFFLPQAADTAIYRPLEGVARDIDILFVGDLYHSPRRREYIAQVIKAFPQCRIKVAGIYKPWYKGPLKALLRERRDIYTNRNIPPQRVNALYNRARVVLNIHNEQQSDGANPKVFEICCAGAYQVCDENPFIRSLFPEGEVGLYGSAEELLARIREALDGDMSRKAEAARCRILSEHTFSARMATVIKDLETL